MTKSQEMKNLLVKAGANIRDLVILGVWVHIDTFAKYEAMLRATLAASGFQCVKISDGIHMDGTSGFRMVFKVQG
jgi:hypothetical protein